MTEHIQAIQELQNLPNGLHVFCHRISDDRADEADDPTEQENREQQARTRRESFFSALPLLAYDGPECHPFHRWLYDTLDTQLAKCDTCIRQYHLQKIHFKAQLEQEYDEGEVAAFLTIINNRDVARIRAGLDEATNILEPLPESQRSARVLGNAQLFSLFETLHCEAFYNNDHLLQKHFDKPFKYVQTQKDLKIKEILPAVTKFLFSTEKERVNWAVKTWQRLQRSPTDEEWDWAIRGMITSELNAITNENGLHRFWSGLRLILEKLTGDQISLKLFDLGFNFPRLALDHLAKNTLAVPQIAQSLTEVWKKASTAYWQALPSVSAATVAEQFFASPNFNKCVEQQASSESKNANLDVLSWMNSFLNGLQPASRPPPARTLVHQLLNRVKSDELSRDAQEACFEAAVKQILSTVLTFADDETRKSVARPVISDVLNMVAHFMPFIMSFKLQDGDGDRIASVKSEVLSLVRNSLTLECNIFKDDFESLSLDKPDTQSTCYTPELWRTIKDNLNEADGELTESMLAGVMQLAGLEQFPIKSDTACKPQKESFNTMLSKVEVALTECIERLADFNVHHLDPLFSQQNTNMALMGMLFSGNENMYQATVEVIKNIAQESGRKEALSHVLQAFLGDTLYSIAWVFRRVTTKGCFAPIPRLLKTGKDIMDILLDTTGLLRSRKFADREFEAVQAYWSYSWLLLANIFQKMEKWSVAVSDKPLMTEVCRNTMQYAKDLFNHYYLFVNILEQNTRNKRSAAQISSSLLITDAEKSTSGSPPKALDSMVKWLRLKDAYLAETLANLIISMLGRLKEYGTELPSNSYALSFVEEVAAGTKNKRTRTILNDNQKAGLVRALEQYTGRQIVRQPTIKKQQRLDAWADPNVKSEATVKTEVIALDDDEFETDVKDEDLRAAEILRQKALLAERKQQRLPQKQSIPARPAVSSLKEQQARQSATSKAFIEQRKKEEAARKARDREIAARARNGLQTANGGSGLVALGVQGKEHVIKRSDLMVSSESEAESSEDDDLFGPTKPTAIINAPGRAGKPAVPVPTRKVKQVRSAKDMRARLSPDLTGLHKTILAWDFFADTETPPNSTKDDYTLVTNTFKTVEDYQKTFEPLLILEGWQSFRTAREDGNFKVFEVKIANSMIVDNFFEVNSTISVNEGKELGLGPSDVVLLSKGKKPHEDPKEPHCFARVKEITRKRGEMQIVYRVNSANNPMRSFLNDKATVSAIRILSLTPLEREYGALMALPFYDLADEIVRAKPSPLLEYSDDEVREIQKLHELNVAQAKAVKSAIDNDAFTLVQGPPGSGKTKTITAILSEIIMMGTNKSKDPRVRADIPPSSKKILIAAPSNAAVDELVMRFKDGIKVSDGVTQKINVVRLGRSEAINAAVKDVTLEELVTMRLSETSRMDGTGGKENVHDVMMEHKKVSEDMVELRNKMDSLRQKSQSVASSDEQLLDAMRRRKTVLSSKIDEMKDKQNSATRDADINRRRIQQEILDSAHVLCATLSGSGHEIFQGLNVEFETVIIDEAAQSIELSALIPLKYGCSKCILVGDPKQLPPTVLSRQAAKYQYEQSLFARMEGNHKADVHLLDVQYRMHPEISTFPSRTFYDSRLRDGGDMARTRGRPWHRSQIFAPYRFFDVQGMSKSAPKGRSLVNEAEIDVALAMYDRLTSDVSQYDFRGKIGIITPYKGQLTRLKQTFSMRYGDSILSAIDFNTTDAFQGRESEIIIFSCVRANTTGIGFLNDVRRMNVGLTRAKCSLWVLGNSQALVQGEFWRALVSDAKDRSLYTAGDVLKIFNRPLLTRDMMQDDVEMGGMDATKQEDIRSTDSESDKPSNQSGQTPTDDNGSRAPSTRPQSVVSSKHSTPQPDAPSRPSSVSSVTRTTNIANQRTTSAAASIRSNAVEAIDRNGVKGVGTATHTAMIEKRGDRNPAAKASNSGVATKESSGGRNGLNPKVDCSICGSSQHFAGNCDNIKAKEAQHGRCQRCGEAGHVRVSCKATRCLACGTVGHEEKQCDVEPSQRLSVARRADVERQEEHHQGERQKNIARLREKQLGEHGGKIPEVKSTVESKRKREVGEDEPRKEPKTEIPTGPSAMAQNGPGPPRARPGGPGGLIGSRPTGGQPPTIRKKKASESSLFARKR